MIFDERRLTKVSTLVSLVDSLLSVQKICALLKLLQSTWVKYVYTYTI